MHTVSLRADCGACAALCCVALAFDRSPSFRISKPAGEPCPHLDNRCACRIHAERLQLGFGGCIAFDCLGAGQRVVQELFGGRSWTEDASLLEPMTEAFAIVRRAHELLMLLDQAGRLELPDSVEARRRELFRLIVEAGASASSIAVLQREARAYFRTLDPFVTRGHGAKDR